MTQVVTHDSLKRRRSLDLQMFADGDGDGTGQEPGNNTPPGGDGNGGSQTEPRTFSEDYVKDLRQEAASWRTKFRELEEKLETQPREITTKVLEALGIEADPDKALEKQLEDARNKAQAAEQRANERLIRAEVKAQAVELGVIDPDAAYALMDRSQVAIGEDGSVQNVKPALEALLKDKPYLKATSHQGNKGGGDFGGNDDSIKNPWKAETFNLTEQGRLIRENPELAARLAAEAKG